MADKEPELDEDGLAIQKYHSMVLIVVPGRDYAEESLRYTRSCLYGVHVGTSMVSVQDTDLIHGRHQDEFIPDGLISDARMDEYSGVIFAGGEGALDLVGDADALRLAREAVELDKLIGAWGQGVAILARAGVIKGKKLTGAPSLEDEVQRAGGKYTGRELEARGKLVTARDDAVGMRFGKALAEGVRI